MQHMSGRGRKTGYTVTGNVVWLGKRTADRSVRHSDFLASLQRTVNQLVGEIQRSGRLKADISAALEARRYELYRGSVSVGERACDRTLAAAERAHVGSLLRFIHAAAAAAPGQSADRSAGHSTGHRSGHRSGHHTDKRPPSPRVELLASSIRELEASVRRAQRLSRDMLSQCQRPDWRDGISPLGDPRPRPASA